MATEINQTPLPCAWCGKAANHYLEADLVGCDTEGCLVSKLMYEMGNISRWNEVQELILSQRRRDFEAGMLAGGYEGCAPPADMPWNMFNDYIKEEHGKDN